MVSKYEYFFSFFLEERKKKKVNGKTSRYFLSDCNLQTPKTERMAWKQTNKQKKESKKETLHLFFDGELGSDVVTYSLLISLPIGRTGDKKGVGACSTWINNVFAAMSIIIFLSFSPQLQVLSEGLLVDMSSSCITKKTKEADLLVIRNKIKQQILTSRNSSSCGSA